MNPKFSNPIDSVNFVLKLSTIFTSIAVSAVTWCLCIAFMMMAVVWAQQQDGSIQSSTVAGNPAIALVGSNILQKQLLPTAPGTSLVLRPLDITVVVQDARIYKPLWIVGNGLLGNHCGGNRWRPDSASGQNRPALGNFLDETIAITRTIPNKR